MSRPNVLHSCLGSWSSGGLRRGAKASHIPGYSEQIRTPEATRPARPSTEPSQSTADYEARRAPLQARSAYRELESDSRLSPAP